MSNFSWLSCFAVLLLSVAVTPAGADKQVRTAGRVRRIVNGESTVSKEFPFFAFLMGTLSYEDGTASEFNMCGGSLIARNVILTAAHCVVHDTDTESGLQNFYLPRDFLVNVGEVGDIDSADEKPNMQDMKVEGYIVHEDYDSVNIVNDIALIFLTTEVALNEYVSLINLPDTDDSALYDAGAAITVIGYGTTETGSTSNVLLKLPYVVVGQSECESVYTDLADGNMCTGVPPMTSRAGTGDSGGPLFTTDPNDSNSIIQVALVSWGPEELQENSYDVNANVLFYKDWITTQMGKKAEYLEGTQSVTSTDTEINYTDLKNHAFLLKKLTPATTGKFVSLTIKSASLGKNSFLYIYNGLDILTNSPLIQVTGSLTKETNITATTDAGLTLLLTTIDNGPTSTASLIAREVDEAGESDGLACMEGYYPCSDNSACVRTALFCDNTQHCQDGSDEPEDGNCDHVKNTAGRHSGQTAGGLVVVMLTGIMLVLHHE